MKTKLIAIALTGLMLTACGGVDPSSPAQSPEEVWDSLKIAAEQKDCDTFVKHTTEKLMMGKSDCEKAFMQYEEGKVPTPNWERNKYSDDGNSVKIYSDTVGGSLATFVKENGIWKTDSKFWR